MPPCSRSGHATERDYHTCRAERAANEVALVEASSAKTAPYRLPTSLAAAAIAALDAGNAKESQAFAHRAREAMEHIPQRAGVERYKAPDAVEHLIVVDGRLALASGDTAIARTRLIEAGRSLSSSAQLSFGPNLTLARDLLAAGDTASVKAYFNILNETWTYGDSTVASWRAALERSADPDFGAKLIY